MEFIFQLTQYNSPTLVDEVASALEKQLEINSRNILPILWRFIDKCNSRRELKVVNKSAIILRKIYGIFLIIIGIILFVPGVMEPKKLVIPLLLGGISIVIGIVNVSTKTQQSYKKKNKIKRNNNKKFRKIAIEILSNMQKELELNTGTPLLVHFTVDGMNLLNQLTISYLDFKNIIEGESIYFLVWNKSVTILQKKDLMKETEENFLAFLEERTNIHRVILG